MLSIAFCLMFSIIVSDNNNAQNLQVLTRETYSFQHLELEITVIRTLDSRTGLITREAFGPDGYPLNLDALRMEEQKMKIAARGKISPELGEILKAAGNSIGVPVAFWLRTEKEPDFRGIINRAVEAGIHNEEARRMAQKTAKQFFSPMTEAFAGLLEDRGCRLEYVGTCWPIVIATVSSMEVSELAALGQVDQAYYAFPKWENENNYAQPTLRTPTVHDRGNKGGEGAVKVMVQDSGGNVATDNPYLPTVIKLNSESTSSHATAVAGNVCMRNHPTLYGGAPELGAIYTASGWGDIDCPVAWDLGMQAGVSFGNCSWWNYNKGSICFLDRFFDYIIRNFGVLMFKSNGNQGGTSTPYSTSPGNGYNMLSTGCYNDGDTIGWDDDAMASYSSYWNPVEGHEKPEVASPGDDVDTTSTYSPWIYYGFNGTSSASPLTMGVATLVANRAPLIVTHPEAVKAVLMVSAWHNVEGAPVLSDKDGAGGIHAGAADAVARDGQYETGTFLSNSFPYDKTILCYEGDGTRVICLWQSDPDSGYTTDVLKMDLDLSVLDPNGNVVATSSSGLNPFEIAYFEPQLTGNYTIRLSKQSFLGVQEPYCIAWSSRQDTAGASVSISGTGQIGTVMNFNFSGQYDPNQTYAGLLSMSTLPDLIPLGKGSIIPVGWDVITNACIFGIFPGWMGTLNGSGQASTSLQLPNNPGLIGMTLYASMVTLDSRNLLLDTAEASSFTIN